ncbi:putative outer membrane protein [Catalinimonas alkaloidigena]|uniref:DUF4142 domain-containing protein n=1 Tax=Catalinimonas alkaloidigena TaxID=1075417 RepID=UPI002405DA22|nr:DUF4142 domain-containing protein [Catalinimonas alkaloidigena]MDF9795751.1 putative outer membrane protein [Catalinimonas alkaloidigena]
MKKTIFVYIFSFFLLIFIISACDSSSTNETSDQTAESASDTVLVESADEEMAASGVDLVLLAFMNNRLQYYMSDLAAKKASAEEVRELAQSINNVEEDARVKLEELAQATETDLPEAIGAGQKMKIDSIDALPQEQFDQAYLTEVVEEYKENVERLNELIIEEEDNPIVAGLVADIKDYHEEQMEKAVSLLEELS